MAGKRTPEIENAILAALEAGESLRKACADNGVTAASVLRWFDEDEALRKRYAQARARGADAEFERLQALVEEEPPVDESGKVDSGWVQWQRLRVDTAKWALAKKRPERYGDRVDVKHNTAPLLININLGDDAPLRPGGVPALIQADIEQAERESTTSALPRMTLTG